MKEKELMDFLPLGARMTIDQELLLHKIETAQGEITLDAYILREVIQHLRDAAKEEYIAGKEYGYEDGYAAGRHAMAQEAKDMIDEL